MSAAGGHQASETATRRAVARAVLALRMSVCVCVCVAGPDRPHDRVSPSTSYDLYFCNSFEPWRVLALTAPDEDAVKILIRP